jgi:hypothetical protein
MFSEIVLMLHPAFGVLGILAGVWVFVEGLNAREDNLRRIRNASLAAAVLIWLACLAGGYWYVVFYAADKAIIKAGPWPFAHSFFMETKEHLFFFLLLLSTYLPMAAADSRLPEDRGARRLVLAVAALVVLLGLVMEGFGAIIGLGVREGLMAR